MQGEKAELKMNSMYVGAISFLVLAPMALTAQVARERDPVSEELAAPSQ
jgi:hypothetical protein